MRSENNLETMGKAPQDIVRNKCNLHTAVLQRVTSIRRPARVRHTARNVAAALLFLAVTACAWATPLTTLPAPIQDVLTQYQIPDESLSIYVQDIATQQPLLAVHERQARNPASVIKVLTTVVALETLGPHYQFKTEAYIDGPLVAGRLQGNLILKGYGDPFFVTEAFRTFVREIRDRGVQHIEGDLIVDNSFFQVPRQAAETFDGQPHLVYNATPTALTLNFQATRFHFYPDTQTQRVRIVPRPRLANLTIENHVRLLQGRCAGLRARQRMYVTHEAAGSRVRFEGSYPLSCGPSTIYRVVSRSVPHVYGVFKAMWEEMDGTLSGGVRENRVPTHAKRLHVVESRPLAELIRGMNKFSNNVMTRQLFLSLAAERYGAPGTVENARVAIRQWLQRQEIEMDGMVVDNGAGLSRQTRISAATLGHVLYQASMSLYMPEFAASLPLIGLDGTMRRRLRGEPLVGHARLKTGSLNNVSALAGYMLSRHGRRFVVVMLINHRRANGKSGRAVQNALLRWVFAQ